MNWGRLADASGETQVLCSPGHLAEVLNSEPINFQHFSLRVVLVSGTLSTASVCRLLAAVFGALAAIEKEKVPPLLFFTNLIYPH